MRKLHVVLAVAVVVLLTLGAWLLWIEPRRLVVHNAELELPRLPAAAAGLRIAVLTDLHIGSPHHGLPKLREIVGVVNRTDPDLVLILGDLVTQGVLGGRFVEPEPIAAELRSLRARLGVFAVLGNHDWWFDAPRVERALEGVGIPVLDDEAVAVSMGEWKLWLAGVSDYWEGRHDIAAALAGVPDGEAVIVFTHNPDIFPDVPERVALTIAGHTHGGQVNLPMLGRPVVPSRFGQRYAAGHVVEQGRHLFVSTGSGTSILPVRFRVPPEIALLLLRPEAGPRGPRSMANGRLQVHATAPPDGAEPAPRPSCALSGGGARVEVPGSWRNPARRDQAGAAGWWLPADLERDAAVHR